MTSRTLLLLLFWMFALRKRVEQPAEKSGASVRIQTAAGQFRAAHFLLYSMFTFKIIYMYRVLIIVSFVDYSGAQISRLYSIL